MFFFSSKYGPSFSIPLKHRAFPGMLGRVRVSKTRLQKLSCHPSLLCMATSAHVCLDLTPGWNFCVFDWKELNVGLWCEPRGLTSTNQVSHGLRGPLTPPALLSQAGWIPGCSRQAWELAMCCGLYYGILALLKCCFSFASKTLFRSWQSGSHPLLKTGILKKQKIMAYFKVTIRVLFETLS